MTIVLHKKIVKKASKMAVLWPIKVTSGPLKKYVWRAEWLSTLHTVQPGENRPLATNFISNEGAKSRWGGGYFTELGLSGRIA